jgi:NAD(P)-dependent dehydrogenase (short-subunit alcohol dehydrogenase family)
VATPVYGRGSTRRSDARADRHPGVQRRVYDHGAFLDHAEEDWWKIIDTNLAGRFHVIQAVLAGMRRAGGGNIVIIASKWGVIGWPEATAYSASKAGLIALTHRERPTPRNNRWTPTTRK